MKRIVIALIIFQILQFIYFSYQTDLLKEVITQNARIANERAQAFAKIILDMKVKTDKLPLKY